MELIQENICDLVTNVDFYLTLGQVATLTGLSIGNLKTSLLLAANKGTSKLQTKVSKDTRFQLDVWIDFLKSRNQTKKTINAIRILNTYKANIFAKLQK